MKTQLIYNDGENDLELYDCEQICFRPGDKINYYSKQGLCVFGTIDRICHVFDEYGNNGYTMDIFSNKLKRTKMIISGFPCIGKSTLASQQSANLRFIDLESSCMFVDGERPENWIQIYINYAIDLNSQGFDVFVSSHKSVREELRRRDVDFYSVYPSKDLKDAWVERLNKRYMAFPDEKNRRAMEYILAHFEESVDDMSNDPKPVEITSANVPLIDFLKYKQILNK